MLRILFWVLLFFFVLYLVSNYYNAKRVLNSYRSIFISYLRQATDYSIAASNNLNPILALVQSCRAEQLIRSVQLVHGIVNYNDLNIDLSTLITIIDEQKTKILKDCLTYFEEYNDNSDDSTILRSISVGLINSANTVD